MPSLLMDSSPANMPIAIREWEEAGRLLANALAHYLKVSTLVETSNLKLGDNLKDLVARIDSSLQTLQDQHKSLDRQFYRSRLTLAKTRNRLASPICHLPEEILSEIFLRVIYSPGAGIKFMGARSIIPLVDASYTCWRPLSAELSVQRSGCQNLQLVVDADHTPACTRKKDWLPFIKQVYRTQSLNIRSQFRQDIPYIVAMILRQGVPKHLSHLSLCYCDRDAKSHSPDPEMIYVNLDITPVRPQFTKLMGSLSAFRLSNVRFDWNYITFSACLVELRVDTIALPGNSAMVAFMTALSSARELRELKLIRIEAFVEQGSRLPRSRLVLPKLTTLHLEGLYFNFLKLILASITPHSYRLTLNLSDLATQNLLVDSDTEDMDIVDVHRLLARYSVHKLILSDNALDWAKGRDLHKLLRSMPTLKVLVINYYELDNKLLKVLEPPPSTRTTPFPELETLELRGSTVPGRITGLKSLVTKHPIQNLVLGQHAFPAEPGEQQVLNLTENDRIVKWLKANVPVFRFILYDVDLPEFADIAWQLWDF